MQNILKKTVKIMFYAIFASIAAVLAFFFGNKSYTLTDYTGAANDDENIHGVPVAHADAPYSQPYYQTTYYSQADYYSQAAYGGEGSEGCEGCEGGEGGL